MCPIRNAEWLRHIAHYSLKLTLTVPDESKWLFQWCCIWSQSSISLFDRLPMSNQLCFMRNIGCEWRVKETYLKKQTCLPIWDLLVAREIAKPIKILALPKRLMYKTVALTLVDKCVETAFQEMAMKHEMSPISRLPGHCNYALSDVFTQQNYFLLVSVPRFFSFFFIMWDYVHTEGMKQRGTLWKSLNKLALPQSSAWILPLE